MTIASCIGQGEWHGGGAMDEVLGHIAVEPESAQAAVPGEVKMLKREGKSAAVPSPSRISGSS